MVQKGCSIFFRSMKKFLLAFSVLVPTLAFAGGSGKDISDFSISNIRTSNTSEIMEVETLTNTQGDIYTRRKNFSSASRLKDELLQGDEDFENRQVRVYNPERRLSSNTVVNREISSQNIVDQQQRFANKKLARFRFLRGR